MSVQRGFIFLTTIVGITYSQCPVYLQNPCHCSSTRYEAVSIVCDKGDSLNSVLIALAQPPRQIDSLTISNTPIDELPAFAFQALNVKKLVFRNNGMRSIHNDAFGGRPEKSLEELEIKGNYFDSIPQLGVPLLKNLKVLALADNIIEYVHDNAFLSYHSRESIQRLDLSANNMSDIHPTGLLGLEKLSQLSLDKNHFHDIPSEALANVPTLEDLSLGVNQIREIPGGALPLPKLKSLSLEVNQIRAVPVDSFQNTPNLAYLYLGNNLLTTIDATAFYYTKYLKVLSVGNNKDIISIPEQAFQYTPFLLRLEIGDCSITTIESGAFARTKNIQVISMPRNQLTSVPSDVLANLGSVVSIDLSSNAITHVEDFAFSQLPSLVTIDLSGNRLESLPKNVFYDTLSSKRHAVQRSLLLHNNPWRCDNELSWLRKWLRDNGDVQISAQGALNPRCWTPAHLSGLDLRQTDPVSPKPEPKKIGDQMRKLIQPAANLLIPSRKNEIVESTQEVPIAGGSLVFLVLGVTLGVLTICVMLIVIIRCIMKNQEKKESGSNFGGSTGSSGFGSSAYSQNGIMGNHLQRSSTNNNVYLNRPRYWWF